MTFFIPLTFATLSNFTLSPPLCYSLKITNYGMREKKIFRTFIVSAYHVKSLGTITFLDTHVCIKQPMLTK